MWVILLQVIGNSKWKLTFPHPNRALLKQVTHFHPLSAKSYIPNTNKSPKNLKTRIILRNNYHALTTKSSVRHSPIIYLNK
jgi:hypothetical protein